MRAFVSALAFPQHVNVSRVLLTMFFSIGPCVVEYYDVDTDGFRKRCRLRQVGRLAVHDVLYMMMRDLYRILYILMCHEIFSDLTWSKWSELCILMVQQDLLTIFFKEECKFYAF